MGRSFGLLPHGHLTGTEWLCVPFLVSTVTPSKSLRTHDWEYSLCVMENLLGSASTTSFM